VEKKKILISGGNGFLGGHLKPLLANAGYEVHSPRSSEVDFRDLRQVRECFELLKPDWIIHLAARVGGIEYNKTRHAEQLYDNTSMLLSVLEGARQSGCLKVLLCGSVCAYSGNAPIPFKEESGLFSGTPEETVFGYGNAKRLFIPFAEAYSRQYGMDIKLPVLANLYGPGDDFNLESCHVIPAMIRRFAEAAERQDKSITLWGSGKVSREFLYVKDAAEVIFRALTNDTGFAPFNVGSGEECQILELVNTLSEILGYEGEIIWDTTRPDGHPRRKLDLEYFNSLFPDWQGTSLKEGLKATVEFYFSEVKGKDYRK
jgi:nucleoside-diphosphate-sugar epimerase